MSDVFNLQWPDGRRQPTSFGAQFVELTVALRWHARADDDVVDGWVDELVPEPATSFGPGWSLERCREILAALEDAPPMGGRPQPEYPALRAALELAIANDAGLVLE